VRYNVLLGAAGCTGVLQCVVSVLQCVAVCCVVLQCASVCCVVWQVCCRCVASVLQVCCSDDGC